MILKEHLSSLLKTISIFIFVEKYSLPRLMTDLLMTTTLHGRQNLFHHLEIRLRFRRNDHLHNNQVVTVGRKMIMTNHGNIQVELQAAVRQLHQLMLNRMTHLKRQELTRDLQMIMIRRGNSYLDGQRTWHPRCKNTQLRHNLQVHPSLPERMLQIWANQRKMKTIRTNTLILIYLSINKGMLAAKFKLWDFTRCRLYKLKFSRITGFLNWLTKVCT